jgi:phosphoglycolate phosphatase-like HAD superfamily hydrolase
MGKENSIMAEIISKAKIIFWDFDGVIKDSVDLKTQAFIRLFESYGEEVAGKVKAHHEANGGMSRFKKIPFYLEMAGEVVSKELVDVMCNRFSNYVFDGVVNADWVPGVEDYIRYNRFNQTFILVSATPQQELEIIMDRIDLAGHFTRIYGAPVSKAEAILEGLSFMSIDPAYALMIGDASADYEAAKANSVPFLLRRHTSNLQVFTGYEGPSIKDFTEI